ncbi:MAG: esterase/lipase family protein [Mariniblastus sp.]
MKNRLSNETVVLVHGLGGSRLDMRPIAKRLHEIGFTTQNWGYWSVIRRLETHATKLAQLLDRLERDDSVLKIHLVGHSMGGIIIRTMLAECKNNRFSKLGRMIMLASPNRGSHVARKLSPLTRWFCPCMEQISDSPSSFVNSLANSPAERGIEFATVEASKDRVIAPDCVQLEGQSDFATINGHHGVMTWYQETIDLIEQFLLEGRFSPERMPIKNLERSVTSQ